MYRARNGLESRVLSYLLSSLAFILCAQSTPEPTSFPTVLDNEPKARLYGGIIGITLCSSILLFSFLYFYPKSAYHHMHHGVDEDQVHRYQLDYFLYSKHDHEIKMARGEEMGTTGSEQNASPPDDEVREFDKNHHRRVDLYQEEAPEPLCEALR